ncbi:hypothetical protein DINM_002060 [Dirofilaria immitis]|nr:hypothetical protein [Dirofilaria immitis]
MEGFLTRRSVAVFTSSLAFAIIYWYIRRRRSLKYSASDNRNTKINAKSHSQKSFESDSKRIAVASVMKPNDGIRDGKPSDNFGNVRLESNQFISELSDDVIIAELENDVINAKTVSGVTVLEILNNSSSESRKNPIDNLSRSDKILGRYPVVNGLLLSEGDDYEVLNEEETSGSSPVWKESKVGNVYVMQKNENAIDERNSDPNIIEYRPLNTPSSEALFPDSIILKTKVQASSEKVNYI